MYRQPASVVPPRIRYWPARGSACVYVDRQRVILGPWGSPKAAARYRLMFPGTEPVFDAAEVPAERVQPKPARARQAAPVDDAPADKPVIYIDGPVTLIEAHAAYLADVLIKRGRPTSTAGTMRSAARTIARAGHAAVRLEHMTPAWLAQLQTDLAAPSLGLTRRTVNDYVRLVRAAAAWGATYGFFPSDAALALKLVPALRKGRRPAPNVPAPPDNRPVQPPPRSWVRRVQRHLPPHPRVMLALQLLTAMRPGELCAMRPVDLTRDERTGVLIYTVPESKTDHHAAPTDADAGDGQRRVYLGKRAQRLLRMVWPPTDREHFFRPAESARLWRERRRAERRTPLYPSHTPEARRLYRLAAGLPERPPRGDGAAYTADSYRRAIDRAIARVQDLEARAGVPERDRVGHSTPYQIRHERATIVAEREDLHTAQHVLGHRDVKTTTRYAHARSQHLIRRAARLG